MIDQPNFQTNSGRLEDQFRKLFSNSTAKSYLIFLLLSLIFIGPIAFHSRTLAPPKFFSLSGEESISLIIIDLFFIAVLAIAMPFLTSKERLLRRKAGFLVLALPSTYFPLSTFLYFF